MNYENARKFEVNAAVSKYALWKNRHCEEVDCNDKTGVVSWADGANWHEFNPHDNPSDAWPIIMENNITLFSPDYNKGDNDWRAEIYDSDEGIFDFTCSNPLRAAMIVFLMMHEERK